MRKPITLEQAKSLAQSYFDSLAFKCFTYEVTASRITNCKYGWIFLAKAVSSDSNFDVEMLGGSHCVLVNKFDNKLYKLAYFGSFDEAIEGWEKENPDKVRL